MHPPNNTCNIFPRPELHPAHPPRGNLALQVKCEHTVRNRQNYIGIQLNHLTLLNESALTKVKNTRVCYRRFTSREPSR